MVDTDRANRERMVTSLLLMGVVLAGVLLMREGAHFDNTTAGERLFTFAFLGGGIAGFLGWTRFTGMTPEFSLSGPSRQLWLATIFAALVCTSGASYINRTFATPTERSKVAAIDSVAEGKGSRWHVVVKWPDGMLERYLITEDTATQLKSAKTVRLRYARGALGFDYVAKFEPVRP